ncbi:GNAT family N-acetyltransferase [Caenispirillum bisanense]|uniref:GNAT family N-acetyltransferase n=1 Tax=Caenispirillum bisanense TaxID=414052 RepID=UPI0031D566CA
MSGGGGGPAALLPVLLRPATAADLDALFDIWLTAVQATHAFLAPADLSFYAGLVRREYLPAAALTVAEADGRPAGFLGLTGSHVDALFVAPDSHDRGIGRRLILDAAVQAGGAALTVDVNEQNAGGVAFYHRLGFVVTGRSPLDPTGRPYPLLHMRRGPVQPAASAFT